MEAIIAAFKKYDWGQHGYAMNIVYSIIGLFFAEEGFKG